MKTWEIYTSFPHSFEGKPISETASYTLATFDLPASQIARSSAWAWVDWLLSRKLTKRPMRLVDRVYARNHRLWCDGKCVRAYRFDRDDDPTSRTEYRTCFTTPPSIRIELKSQNYHRHMRNVVRHDISRDVWNQLKNLRTSQWGLGPSYHLPDDVEEGSDETVDA